MTTDHRVWTSDPADTDRVHWECSCGAAGSCPDFQADIASDRHIRPGESRSDISKPDWPCISRHGEFGNHILDDAYTCTRCLVLDEDALVDELRRARAELARCEEDQRIKDLPQITGLIAEAIRDEAKHYPGDGTCEDRCSLDEDVCMSANVHLAAKVNGVIESVYASPDRIAAVAAVALRPIIAELEAARPVVEAADAWRDDLGTSKALAAAVDLYRSASTRNLDSAVPDPSLAAETLPTTEEKP